jgi:hypothetical protein
VSSETRELWPTFVLGREGLKGVVLTGLISPSYFTIFPQKNDNPEDISVPWTHTSVRKTVSSLTNCSCPAIGLPEYCCYLELSRTTSRISTQPLFHLIDMITTEGLKNRRLQLLKSVGRVPIPEGLNSLYGLSDHLVPATEHGYFVAS